MKENISSEAIRTYIQQHERSCMLSTQHTKARTHRVMADRLNLVLEYAIQDYIENGRNPHMVHNACEKAFGQYDATMSINLNGYSRRKYGTNVVELAIRYGEDILRGNLHNNSVDVQVWAYLDGLGIPNKLSGYNLLADCIKTTLDKTENRYKSGKLNFADLADKYNLSPYTVSRNCQHAISVSKKAFGMTPYDVSLGGVVHIRMSQANMPTHYNTAKTVLAEMGLNQNYPGFELAALSIAISLSFERPDRRPFLNQVYPIVSETVHLPIHTIQSAIEKALAKNITACPASEFLFRVVDIIDPPDDDAYQTADRVMAKLGMNNRQRLKGYEYLRMCVVHVIDDKTPYTRINCDVYKDIGLAVGKTSVYKSVHDAFKHNKLYQQLGQSAFVNKVLEETKKELAETANV